MNETKKEGNYTTIITGVTAERKGDYTVYLVKLQNGDDEWEVEKRFSDFFEFHKQLLQKLPRDQAKLLPPFPKKSIFNTSNAFIERRRGELENYLKVLLELNYFKRRKYLLRPIGFEYSYSSTKFDRSFISSQSIILSSTTTLPTVSIHNGDIIDDNDIHITTSSESKLEISEGNEITQGSIENSNRSEEKKREKNENVEFRNVNMKIKETPLMIEPPIDVSNENHESNEWKIANKIPNKPYRHTVNISAYPKSSFLLSEYALNRKSTYIKREEESIVLDIDSELTLDKNLRTFSRKMAETQLNNKIDPSIAEIRTKKDFPQIKKYELLWEMKITNFCHKEERLFAATDVECDKRALTETSNTTAPYMILLGTKDNINEDDTDSPLLHQYHILKNLNELGVTRGIPTIIELINESNYEGIVFKYIDAQPLHYISTYINNSSDNDKYNSLSLVNSFNFNFDFSTTPNLQHVSNQHLYIILHFLNISLLLSEILESLHENNYVHNYICPKSLLYNPKTNQLYLINFHHCYSSNAMASEENLHTYQNDAEIIDIMMPYSAPEKFRTFRNSHHNSNNNNKKNSYNNNSNSRNNSYKNKLDQQTETISRKNNYYDEKRSDIYSLGVTLFELLTGRSPYEIKERYQLVHAHLAQKPLRCEAIIGFIPPIIGDIIDKMLFKELVDRYLSVYSLKSDFLICLNYFVSFVNSILNSSSSSCGGNEFEFSYHDTFNIKINEIASFNDIEKLIDESPDTEPLNLQRGNSSDVESHNIKVLTQILPRFSIGVRDFSSIFKIPKRLYDRQKALTFIEESAQQVRQGNKEMVIINGDSGVGKSAVIHYFLSQLNPNEWLILNSRFDQISTTPFGAFRFKNLAHQLLSKSAEDVAFWRDRLRAVLFDINSPHAGGSHLVYEMMDTELQNILGPLPPVLEKGNSKSQRGVASNSSSSLANLQIDENSSVFNITLIKFIGALGMKGKPVVLFLDDLQWIDPPSLQLLSSILFTDQIDNLLIIGAYRKSEFHTSSLLDDAISEWEEHNVAFFNFQLFNLELSDLKEFVFDSLRPSLPLILSNNLNSPYSELCNIENHSHTINPITKILYFNNNNINNSSNPNCNNVKSEFNNEIIRNQRDTAVEPLRNFYDIINDLSQIILVKTAGNPFFVHHFLKNIYDEKILSFDKNNHVWVCKIEEMKQFEYTENVIFYLSKRILRLPQHQQNILMKAACIGGEFTFSILYSILEEDERTQLQDTLVDLCDLILIIPDSNISVDGDIIYKFVHERVQKAAYSLLSTSLRSSLHLQIGLAHYHNLKNDTTKIEESEKLYEIVNHFNEGWFLLDNINLKIKLSILNLKAGCKAYNTNSPNIAHGYYKFGLYYLLYPNPSVLLSGSNKGSSNLVNTSSNNLNLLNSNNQELIISNIPPISSIDIEKLKKSDEYKSHYNLLFQLILKLYQCEHTLENYKEANILFQILINISKTLYEKSYLYNLKSELEHSLNNLKKSLTFALSGLQLYEIHIPLFPTFEYVSQFDARLFSRLLDLNLVQFLTKYPDLSLSPIDEYSQFNILEREDSFMYSSKPDFGRILSTKILDRTNSFSKPQEKKARGFTKFDFKSINELKITLELLTKCISSGANFSPSLSFISSMYIVHLSMVYGLCDETPLGLMVYGMINIYHFERLDFGCFLVKMAIELLSKFPIYKAKIWLIYGDWIQFWLDPTLHTLEFLSNYYHQQIEKHNTSSNIIDNNSNTQIPVPKTNSYYSENINQGIITLEKQRTGSHLKGGVEYLWESLQQFVSNGQCSYANFAMFSISRMSYQLGESLPVSLNKHIQAANFAKQTNQKELLIVIEAEYRLMCLLMGEVPEKLSEDRVEITWGERVDLTPTLSAVVKHKINEKEDDDQTIDAFSQTIDDNNQNRKSKLENLKDAFSFRTTRNQMASEFQERTELTIHQHFEIIQLLYYCIQMELNYYLNQAEKAFFYFLSTSPIADCFNRYYFEKYFWGGLVLATLVTNKKVSDAKIVEYMKEHNYKEILQLHLMRTKKFARYSPINYEHRYNILKAECYRVLFETTEIPPIINPENVTIHDDNIVKPEVIKERKRDRLKRFIKRSFEASNNNDNNKTTNDVDISKPKGDQTEIELHTINQTERKKETVIAMEENNNEDANNNSNNNINCNNIEELKKTYSQKVVKYFVKAIRSAREHEYVQYEALANELLAKFYHKVGSKEQAVIHFNEALRCYALWGAAWKSHFIQLKYQFLLSSSLLQRSPTSSSENYKRNTEKLSAIKKGNEHPLSTAQEMISSNNNQLLERLSLSSDNNMNDHLQKSFTLMMKINQIVNNELTTAAILKCCMMEIMEYASAQRAFLILSYFGKLYIEAQISLESSTQNNSSFLQSHLLTNSTNLLSFRIINYVTKSKNQVEIYPLCTLLSPSTSPSSSSSLSSTSIHNINATNQTTTSGNNNNVSGNDLSTQSPINSSNQNNTKKGNNNNNEYGYNYANDPYIQANLPKSLLCIPIIMKNEIIGALYLENRLISGVFVHVNSLLLSNIATQLIMQIENARMSKYLTENSHFLFSNASSSQSSQNTGGMVNSINNNNNANPNSSSSNANLGSNRSTIKEGTLYYKSDKKLFSSWELVYVELSDFFLIVLPKKNEKPLFSLPIVQISGVERESAQQNSAFRKPPHDHLLKIALSQSNSSAITSVENVIFCCSSQEIAQQWVSALSDLLQSPHILFRRYNTEFENGNDAQNTSTTPNSNNNNNNINNNFSQINHIENMINKQLPNNLSNYNIHEKDIVWKKLIGQGSEASVFLALWKGIDVACKVFKTGESLLSDDNQQSSDEFFAELAIIKTLRHPNVLMFIGAFLSEKGPTIVTEYMEKGSLYTLLHTPSYSIDENLKLQWIKEIASGMLYLHSFQPPIIHRDLKSHNILISYSDHVKIADFGMARLISTDRKKMMTGMTGTVSWMAPEVFESQSYSELADVFSFGIIMWEILTREELYPHLKFVSQIGLAVSRDGLRPPIPPNTPDAWEKLMSSCWSHDPSFRPTFRQILNFINNEM